MDAPTLYKPVTLTTSTDPYAAGDAVGGLLEFPVLPENYVWGGMMASVVVTAQFVNIQPEMDLVLFNDDFEAGSDNAAFEFDEADRLKCLGTITIETYHWKIFGSIQVATVMVSLPAQLNPEEGVDAKDILNIQARLVTRTVFTAPNTSAITAGLGLLRD